MDLVSTLWEKRTTCMAQEPPDTPDTCSPAVQQTAVGGRRLRRRRSAASRSTVIRMVGTTTGEG